MLHEYKKYCKEIHQQFRSGDATENSYYDKLKTLIEEIGFSDFDKKTTVTINPKKVIQKQETIGLPDFVVKTEIGFVVGYVEAKDPSVELQKILFSEQIERYKKLPNFILTNFCEFYFFRNGNLMRHSILFDNSSLRKLTLPKLINLKDIHEIFKEFFSFSTKKTTTAEGLAKELGDRSQILKHVLLEELKLKNKDLIEIYNVFNGLIKDLTIDRFANLYAQTIAYGLFFAAIKDKKNELSRTNAYTFIPTTIPILNKLFYFLTGTNLPNSIGFIVDDLIEVLRKTAITSILQQFKTTHWTKDPLIHFYETFLSEYDPQTRDKRGVFYTPAPVVSYIMKSIHAVLKKTFQKNEGLAEKSVKVLDPAAGSMTFLDTAIHLCYDEYKIRGKSGIFKDMVTNHILEDFFAFEILIAPYTIGHFKIFNTLENLGIEQEKRINLFLTNALEIEEIAQSSFLPALNDENRKANEIKLNPSVLVVCGNPPYESSSMNKSKFISKLMMDYKKDVSEEKNIQPLDNDYIKFIRFAHWKIKQNGHGLVGMITSNSYLDGIIHKGMRKMLLDDFNQIYILNLHGSVRRNENPPNGKSDENIFDIMQGVSIIFLIKTQSPLKSEIFYQDLWGTREEKYEFLTKNFIDTTKWLKLTPKSPNYFFAFLNEKEEYSDFVPLSDIFIEKSTGVKTHRDKFIVCTEKETLLERLEKFSNTSQISDQEIQDEFSLKETDSWKISTARKKFKIKGIDDKKIKLYHYRPFDFQFTYHSPILIDRSRGELIGSISDSNIALAVTRQVSDPPFHHVFVTNSLSDICLISTKTKESAYFFPMFRILDGVEVSNMSRNFILNWQNILAITISELEIFDYIYALLNSEEFRKKYINSLLRDFPKIPIISDKKIFLNLVDLGGKLRDLHLLKNSSLSIISEYPISGNNLIERVRYDENEHRIYVNRDQYFSNISLEIWDFRIGSYYLVKKWLDTKTKTYLTSHDIDIFQNIVNMIHETKILQKRIDSIFPSVLENVVKIDTSAQNLDAF